MFLKKCKNVLLLDNIYDIKLLRFYKQTKKDTKCMYMGGLFMGLKMKKEELELLSNKDIAELILQNSKRTLNTADLFKKIMKLFLFSIFLCTFASEILRISHARMGCTSA